MKIFFGVVLVGFSLFMLLGFFASDSERGLGVEIATLLFLVVFPLICGGGLIRSHYKNKSRAEEQKEALRKKTLESEVLKLAGKKGGKLTTIEVVADLMMDHVQAKQVLNSLAEQGFAGVELTDSGVIVYAFYDLRHLNEKENAKGVLDA